jgi:sulfoxide reductase heme-binding subunit YedZ
MREAQRKIFGGWTLVGCASLLVAVMCAALVIAHGSGEHGLRLVVRNTARTSFLFFVSAFVARALHTLWQTRASLWLGDNQPYLYASFAASHLIHAAAIFALAAATHGESLAGRSATTIIGGGGAVAYLFIALAAAPAFPRAAAFVESHARVSALRAFGLYYVWVIFMFSYGGRAVQSSFYKPFAFALVAALALRAVALRRTRTRAGSSADAAAF